MAHRLDGRLAMVTGGGNGIGRAVCEVFAREGACIAIVDIDENSARETLNLLKGSNHCAIVADVSKAGDVKRAFEGAEKKLGGKCNILVNNAGVAGEGTAVSEKSELGFDRVMDINLKGAFLMAREFLKSVEKVDEEVRGVIINMSSIAGKIGLPMAAGYAASKAGVIGLTKSMATEFIVHRVRCNAVLPGITETRLLFKSRPEFLEHVKKLMVFKRFAQPEEIANVILFLASDESSYVHGSCLEVSGGLGM